VLHNTLAGAVAKRYPVGNDYPTLAQWLADFVDPAKGDYRLVATSLSRGAGTDGKDLGVDFVELNAAMNGAPSPAPAPAPTPTPTPPPPPAPGSACGKVTLDKTAFLVGSGEANWVIYVTAPTADCTWTATADSSWLVVKSTSPVVPHGSGFVKVRALPMSGTSKRVGHFLIGGVTFTVTQTP